MKLVLITLAAVLVILGTYYAAPLLTQIFEYLLANPAILAVVALAVGVQVVGHVFRAARTKLITDQAAPSSVKFQFGALSIGYLFNTLLPFRFGELVRAYLVARRLRISFLYTLTAIVIERAIDILLLGLIILVGVWLLGSTVAFDVTVVATILIALALLALVGLLLLKAENKFVLGAVAGVSRIFNERIGNAIRFKVWSLIFGLQNFFNNPRLVRQYIGYVAVSWLCYIASILIVVVALVAPTEAVNLMVASITPYAVLALQPIDIGTAQQIGSAFPGLSSLGAIDADLYGKLIWAILVLPMAAFGVVSLVLYKTARRPSAEISPYVNKLLRYDDISQDFPSFLDTYFKGAALSRILHKIEVNGELSLVKFFKGGSDAITVLALKGDDMFVKKIVPAKYTDRLKVQYNWLKKQSKKKQIVDVLGEHLSDDYYAIDLAYNPENISLFEYIHTHSLQQSKKALGAVWKYLFENLYKLEKEAFHEKERDEYIEDRLFKKLETAIAQNDDLTSVITAKKIKINGETYDNLYTILDKIKNHEQAWRDIGTYRASSVVHGDMTVDNILINTNDHVPLLIDPSDDNQIRGPIIDLGRHTQSLIAGYEFLNNDEEAVKATIDNGVVAINYHDRKSAHYMQLYDYLRTVILKKYFTPTEQKTSLFHAGLFYARMLAHRVVINPANPLKYYAVSVVLLNRFYDQYKD